MRLFLTLPLSPEVLVALQSVQNQLLRDLGYDHFKLVKPSDFHCTLLSLGDRNPGQWDGIAGAAATIASDVVPFEIRFSAVSSFPKAGPTRTIICRLSAGSDAAADIVGIAEPWFTPMGVPKSGGLQPHITLARVPPEGDGLLVAEYLQQVRLDIGCMVESLNIFETFLEPTGARHVLRQAFPFRRLDA